MVTDSKGNFSIIKSFIYALVYWVLCIIFPFMLTGYIAPKDSVLSGLFGTVFTYILLIAPLLYIVPFKLSKLPSIKAKTIYIIGGLILPYIMVYIYAYYGFTHMKMGLF